MTRVFLVLVVVFAALFGAGAWGSMQWQKDSTAAAAKLECCAVANPMTYNPDVELTGLPEPVQRYFRNVLRPGQVLIRRARQVQEGEFAMNGGWSRMRASQVSVANSPGFVWDARIAMAGGLMDARVRDSYASGNASMTAKVLGLVTLVDAPNGPELATGALQRHLGEAVWFPTALLPSQGVTWTAIDANTSRATITDRGVTASLNFRFNAAGEVTGTFTEGRYKAIDGGKFVLEPWTSTCSDYAERGGMKIPLRAEVAWGAAERSVPYWRARITAIEYE